jgi:hypothetical protein
MPVGSINCSTELSTTSLPGAINKRTRSGQSLHPKDGDCQFFQKFSSYKTEIRISIHQHESPKTVKHNIQLNSNYSLKYFFP